MSLHLIIDGYNIIRQTPAWQTLEAIDLQWGRQALLESLAAYRREKKYPITVVFDGTAGGEILGNRDYYQGILVLYSRQGEKADDVIKRLVDQERERSLVISSDREIMDHALRAGATVMAAAEFSGRLLEPAGTAEATGEADEYLPPHGTKKKGPAHRAPKKIRRLQRRLKKI